jgi:hypothetical protein
MKGLVKTKGTNRSKPLIYGELDSHKWATKMEIRRLLSSKGDLKIKAVEKQTA